MYQVIQKLYYMPKTRYSESRVLVRGLHRLQGESRAEFKAKIGRLRQHFKQFNLDVSEICQWLMSIRPDGKYEGNETKAFWDFFLEPEDYLDDDFRNKADRIRRIIFDICAGLDIDKDISKFIEKREITGSIDYVASKHHSSNHSKLFLRLSQYRAIHRQILLKASAEWVTARYQRGFDNWVRHRKEWEKEKEVWEKEHPTLNEEIRLQFNNIYSEFGIREKKPRICDWERLKELKDNCLYAGEWIYGKRHSELCAKYNDFIRSYSGDKKIGKNVKRYFVKNTNDYLRLKKNLSGKPVVYIMQKFLERNPSARWFPDVWQKYLRDMNIDEKTIIDCGTTLPHCTLFASDKDCEFNKHTEKCILYRNNLIDKEVLQSFETLYREWRVKYLSGPRKPSFRYPSSRDLPMPKIFGKDFFRIDFENSIFELRMDNMVEGQFIPFGFKPWPPDYKPQPHETEITSVHINFIGNRARAAFRFQVSHKESGFKISQDQLDILRSRKYPRQAQDQKFLNEARDSLCKSFVGEPEKEMKILTVDLGDRGGYGAIFHGRTYKESFPLKIIKIDKLYEALPKRKAKDNYGKKGLIKEHVGRHLETWSEGAARIAEKRNSDIMTLGKHDMRRLGLHIRWMLRDWVRLNASQIIEMAEQNIIDLIVFESMRGFNAPGRDKVDPDKKLRLAYFAFGRIRHKVVEKAVEKGMRLITVPYLKSSQYCARCGKKQEDQKKWSANKRKRLFICENKGCPNKCNSDENAARVLGRVFWGEILLPVE